MLRVFFLSIRLAVFTLGIEGLTVQFVGAYNANAFITVNNFGLSW